MIKTDEQKIQELMEKDRTKEEDIELVALAIYLSLTEEKTVTILSGADSGLNLTVINCG